MGSLEHYLRGRRIARRRPLDWFAAADGETGASCVLVAPIDADDADAAGRDALRRVHDALSVIESSRVPRVIARGLSDPRPAIVLDCDAVMTLADVIAVAPRASVSYPEGSALTRTLFEALAAAHAVSKERGGPVTIGGISGENFLVCHTDANPLSLPYCF